MGLIDLKKNIVRFLFLMIYIIKFKFIIYLIDIYYLLCVGGFLDFGLYVSEKGESFFMLLIFKYRS